MTDYELDPRNARTHSDEQKNSVQKSLDELGAGRSIVVDADGKIIGGNAVYEQAQELGIPVKEIETSGDELVVVRRVALRAKSVKDCLEYGYRMLPQGLPLYETVLATGDVLGGLPSKLLGGTLLVATGTGTILAGLIYGLLHLAKEPERIIGVSASMSTSKQAALISKRLSGFVDEGLFQQERVDHILSRLTLLKAEGDYYTRGRISTPWPSHPYYEWKVMDVLASRLKELPEPIIFWNVGA